MAHTELEQIRPQVYKDPRPAETFAPFHARTRSRGPDFIYEATRAVTCLYAWTVFRARAIHAERVPAAGPVILAPNHFSFMDHFFLGGALRRKVHFMAKSQLFKPPMQWIFTHGGVFPVRRGLADDEAFITARVVLRRGGCVGMYAEGGRSRTGTLSERARRGIGRLALESGAPVVPVAIHGSARVRNWKRMQFPRVTVLYGDPVAWEQVEAPTRDQQQTVADAVFAEIKRLYREVETHGTRELLRRGRRGAASRPGGSG
jgi:1-acyl-sn-glycerol-3-phosphate acyltransferase